jgi:Cu/Ag efflux pump CusA
VHTIGYPGVFQFLIRQKGDIMSDDLSGFVTQAKDAEPRPDSRLVRWLHRHYRRLLLALLARPMLALVGVVPLLLCARSDQLRRRGRRQHT